MLYKLNIIGEFADKEIENVFLEGEVRKGMKLIRIMILFSSLAFLLIGIPDLFRKDIDPEILVALFIFRIVIFLAAVVIFIVMHRSNDIKFIRSSIYVLASVIYSLYFSMAFFFVPLNIMSPTFAVILLSTCLFMLPIRWFINLCFSLAYIVLFVVLEPYLCATTEPIYRFIAVVYLCWNFILISILFYNINIYKRNYFAKAYQLEQLANTDQLTRIHNRKSCDDFLETRCAGNAVFSIIMFDIDDFKHINDTYGHVAGDDVLISITDYARKIIRKDDILARWGGEEFVIIMLDAELFEAAELAKRLKDQLTRIEHDGISQSITCSFGVTTFIEGENVKSIIRRADQLLYLAKEYGKNRVVAG